MNFCWLSTSTAFSICHPTKLDRWLHCICMSPSLTHVWEFQQRKLSNLFWQYFKKATASIFYKNCAKMLVYWVLSDKYRKTQEQFLYRGVEIFMTFRAYILYKSQTVTGNRKLCKMLLRRVLSDRYRITQEKLQYQGAGI